MLIVLGCIFIAMIIGGSIMLHCSGDCEEPLGVGGIVLIVVGSIAIVTVVVFSLCLINSLVQTYVIDDKIAMYEEQNSQIEEQIATVVHEYQEYESGIMTEIGDNESYITLVSLYPELKADALVSKQIEVYLNNNQIIASLKSQKLNERVYRWWLYFGS